VSSNSSTAAAAARELADDLVNLLAGTLQLTPTQIRQAYQRSRQTHRT
jgi:hypothetical protein